MKASRLLGGLTVASVLTLVACAGRAHAAPPARSCSGHITDRDGAPIGVKVRRGNTPCSTAKRVLRVYLNSDAPCEGSACTRGWTCLAASPANYPRVASCTRGRRLIAAYAIVD